MRWFPYCLFGYRKGNGKEKNEKGKNKYFKLLSVTYGFAISYNFSIHSLVVSLSDIVGTCFRVVHARYLALKNNLSTKLSVPT